MPSIGQAWVLATIGAVVEMGVLSTLKRLLMESSWILAFTRIVFCNETSYILANEKIFCRIPNVLCNLKYLFIL
jgi:hypothetical protein